MKYAIVIAAAIVVGCGSTPMPTSSTGLLVGPDGFPTEVLGMPVLSIGGANQLIAQGKLNGRVAAVGGWWLFEPAFSCPGPGGYTPALIGYCSFQHIASAPFATWVCTQDGSMCQSGTAPPGVVELEVHEMPETAGEDRAGFGRATQNGVPVVVIGHAGDARRWDCPAGQREECAGNFVIDRVVWANGEPVDELANSSDVTPRLTAEEAVAAAKAEGAPLLATAVSAGELMTIDPRLAGHGGSTVWVVRTLRAEDSPSSDDPTRAVDQTLVDDGTGNVLIAVGLEQPADYQPAILLVQATQTNNVDNNITPYYRVETAAGVLVQEMRVGSWASSDGPVQRYGAGGPVILEAGDYVVHAYLARVGAAGPLLPRDDCSKPIHLEGAPMRLQADFPPNGPCEFHDPTFEDVP